MELKSSLLLQISRKIVNVDGTPRGYSKGEWSKLNELYRERFINALREGSIIYIPLTTTLQGFPGVGFIIEMGASIEIIRDLITELLEAKVKPIHIIGYRIKPKKGEYINTSLMRKLAYSLHLCRGEELQAYLTISGHVMEYILNYLDRRRVIIGVEDAFRSLFSLRGLGDTYLRCRDTRYKSIPLNFVFRGIYRVYENLLVASGAALYKPRTAREMRVGRGRNVPYYLYKTPLTTLLYRILALDDRESLKDYVKVYKGLMEAIIEPMRRGEFRVSELYSSIGHYLNRLRAYGVEVEDIMIEDITLAIIELLRKVGVISEVTSGTYRVT